MSKIIKDDADKKAAVVIATGVIAIASIIGGNRSLSDDELLTDSNKLATAYVDLLMDAEADNGGD